MLAIELDQEGMVQYLINFPTDIVGSFSRLESSHNSWINAIKAKNWNGILCLGMGGSAAGGEFLSTLSDYEGNLPIRVNRNYDIPNWWTKEWLVIATSYSGNTEETIAASEKVLKRDGTLIGLCSGGELAGICEIEENAHLCLIPSGQPPRSAFGHIFGTQLAIAWELGIIQKPADIELQQMISRIQQYISLYDFTQNQNSEVSTLANAMNQGNIAILGSIYLAPAVNRFCCQFNENSGMFARSGILPEMCHNEIVAWGKDSEGGDPDMSNQSVIILDWKGANKRIKQRTSWFIAHLSTQNAWRINCEGESLLEAMIYSCIAMDWVSCALALIRGKNPSSIGPITSLKSYLSNMEPE